MNKFRNINFFAVLIALTMVLSVNAGDAPRHSVQRVEGIVPDEKTAKSFAEAILIPISGSKFVKKETFINPVLTNGMWIINVGGGQSNPKKSMVLHISKQDGRVSITNVGGREQATAKRGQVLVPDAATAVLIAEAVLSPIYGKDKIKHERPFEANRNKGVWVVQGTLEEGLVDKFFGATMGGVALVELSSEDASILRVTHGK